MIQGSRFGEVAPWDEGAVHQERAMIFPRALMVLLAERQEREVVRKILVRIMTNVDPLLPASSKYGTKRWPMVLSTNI